MPRADTQSQHYLLIEAAINFLLEHHTEQPALRDIASHIGLSESYFQRLFVDWVGISPKRFLQFLTREHMKVLLDQGYSTLDAAYQVGLSGGGRSHELFVSTQAITPSQYRQAGKNLLISYGFHHSPLGEYLLAVTDRGICHISFITGDKAATESSFKKEWSLAQLQHEQALTEVVHQQIFYQNAAQEIQLLLRGTPFQLQVWQALLSIPFGKVSSYETLAKTAGNSAATRAAASAIARNRIAYLIPCHRVIHKIGESGEYRWGSTRKKMLLAYESAVAGN